MLEIPIDAVRRLMLLPDGSLVQQKLARRAGLDGRDEMRWVADSEHVWPDVLDKLEAQAGGYLLPCQGGKPDAVAAQAGALLLALADAFVRQNALLGVATPQLSPVPGDTVEWAESSRGPVMRGKVMSMVIQDGIPCGYRVSGLEGAWTIKPEDIVEILPLD